MARTKKVNTSNCGGFRHGTSIGANGEILYDAPIVIEKNDSEVLTMLGITKKDCTYLSFNGSEKVRVYLFKTTDRRYAEMEWENVNNLHSSGYFKSRCMVPGKRDGLIRCRDTNKCAECPYGRKPEDKQAQKVSLDGLLEDGYDPAAEDSVERQVVSKGIYQEIRKIMDNEDPRMADAFEAKTLLGYSAKEIAKGLGVSVPRVYQLLDRAVAIGQAYRAEYLDD